MANSTHTPENTPWTSALFNHSVASKAWLSPERMTALPAAR